MKKRTVAVTVRGIFLGLLCLLILPQTSFADSGTSTCGNLTVNDPTDTCHTVTPPLLTTTITIDGTESGVEWAGAQTKSLSGDFTGTIKMFREPGTLYILVTVNEGNYNANDQVRIFIDPLHNHATTTDDFEFRIKRDVGGSPDHRKISPSGDVAWDPAVEGSELDTSSSATDWTIEVKLTAAELGVSDLPSIMGFGIQAEDNPDNNLGTWPASFVDNNPTTTWANLKTRYPIDYMIVLDQSGSMLSQNKWNDAKTAANFMANAMSILGNPTYFEDRLGVVSFHWLCSGGGPMDTQTAKSLATIPMFPVGNYTDDAPAVTAPLSNFCTPIGEGLKRAFESTNLNANASTASEERQRGVLLLSDGLQNRPSNTFAPADTGYDPCPGELNWNQCPANIVSNVPVNTVALGEDWGVDTTLLQNATIRYGGAFLTTYNITTDPEDLKEIFIGSLESLYRMNLISAGPVNNFTVNPGEHRIVAILSWSTPGDVQATALERLDGGSWVSESCNLSDEDSTVGFAICTVDNPTAGTWRVAKDGGGSFSPNPNRQFILVDLKLRARFGVDQVAHGTGNDIVLTVELEDGGRPVTHDPASHPVKVTVNIDEPKEGFGTFVSTHLPKVCEEAPPQLPNLDPGGGLIGTFPGVGLTTRFNASAVAASSGDPPAPHFALMEELLRSCDKDGLLRAEEPGLELRDDGTQGDKVPDDGIYTLSFNNTEYEGSYLFRFNVEGTTADGAPFARTKLIARYVRVDVDPDNTESDSRVIQQSGNLVFKEYHVLPRDRFGGYLGPGHPDQIQFFKTGGQWLSPVLDYNNGYYARILLYDKTKGEPQVSIVVQGKSLAPTKLPSRLLCLLIILLLLLIILLLLLYVRRLRRWLKQCRREQSASN